MSYINNYNNNRKKKLQIKSFRYLYKKKPMNTYFMKITKEERENILDKHKSLYDGYSVRDITPSEQPLHTLDLAGDKNGITLDNHGNVGQYNNKLHMKESKNVCEQCSTGVMVEGICEQCGYNENEVSEGIHDEEDINPENKFDYTEEEGEHDEPEFLPKTMTNENINESVNKSLDWFKKFQKYN